MAPISTNANALHVREAKLASSQRKGAIPKGPKGERGPADANKRAFAIMRIATDEDANPMMPDQRQCALSARTC